MKKMKKQGGFTLVEMLIVVAIIAILIAISIPLINNALERARHATDAANERAAKAEILIQYLAGDDTTTVDTDTVYYYNAAEGSITKTYADAGPAYGKHANGAANRTASIIALSVDADGVVTMQWTNAALTGSVTADANLCGINEVGH